MISDLQCLIDVLRDELQHYGEMLALLEQQQDLIVRRATSELLNTVALIQAQADAVQNARARREDAQARLSSLLGLKEDAPFKELIAALPSPYQPLVDALIQENNQLLVRVHQRSRQNHLLLTRSVELMQKLINSLAPTADGPTYNEYGVVLAARMPVRSIYSAVG